METQLTVVHNDLVAEYTSHNELQWRIIRDVFDERGHLDRVTDRYLTAAESSDAARALCEAEAALSVDALLAVERAEEAVHKYRGTDDKACGDALRVLVRALLQADLHQRALETAQAELSACKGRWATACMQLAVAEVQLWRQRPAEALRPLKESLATFTELGDFRMEALVLLTLAVARGRRKHPKEALQAVADATVRFEDLKDKAGEARCWLLTAQLQETTPEAFIRAMQKAMVIFKDLGDTRAHVQAYNSVASMRLEREDAREALKVSQEALAHARRAKDMTGLCVALSQAVRAHAARREGRQAVLYASDVVAWCKQQGEQAVFEGQGRMVLAQAHLAAQDTQAALKQGFEAVQLLRAQGDKRPLSRGLAFLALLHLANGEDEWAMTAANEARGMLSSQDARGLALVLQTLISVHHRQKQPDKARAALGNAVAVLKASGERRWLGLLFLSAYDMHRQAGDIVAALDAAHRARWAFQEAEDHKGLAAAQLAAAELHLNVQGPVRALKVMQKAELNLQRHSRSLAVAKQMQASLHIRLDNVSEAMQLAQEAQALAKRAEDPRAQVHATYVLIKGQLNLLNIEAHKLSERIPHAKGKRRDGTEFSYPVTFDYYRKQDTDMGEQEYEALRDTVKVHKDSCQQSLRMAKDTLTVATAQVGDKFLIADGQHIYAETLLINEHHDEALKTIDQAVATANDCGHWLRKGHALIFRGEVLYSMQQKEQALESAERGKRLCKKLGDMEGEAYGQAVMELISPPPPPVVKKPPPPPISKAKPGSYRTNSSGRKTMTVYKTVKVSRPKASKPKAKKPRAPGSAVARTGPKLLDPEVVRGKIRDEVASLIGIDDKELQDDSALMDSGLDSLGSVEFRNQLVKSFKIDLPATLSFDYPNIRSLTECILDLAKENALSQPQSAQAQEEEEEEEDEPGEVEWEEVEEVVAEEVEVDDDGTEHPVQDSWSQESWSQDSWQSWEPEQKWTPEPHGASADDDDDDEEEEEVVVSSKAVSVKVAMDPEMIRGKIRDEVTNLIGIEDAQLEDDTPLMDSGLDSLGSVEFRNQLVKVFKGVDLPSTLSFDFPTVKELVNFVVENAPTEEKVPQTSAPKVKKKKKASPVQAQLTAPPKPAQVRQRKIKRPCITGSWDRWAVHEMPWDADSSSFQAAIRLGATGEESFQILQDGIKTQALYPDKNGATPHAPHEICGPDDDGSGTFWTVGKHQKDGGAEGAYFQIRLIMANGGVDRIAWTKLEGTGLATALQGLVLGRGGALGPPSRLLSRRDLPMLVGSWNSWGTGEAMGWDDSDQRYSSDIQLGKQGWESFQILLDGDSSRCLHPDRKDACPHIPYELCGPDDEGTGKHWTVGKHPLDGGSPGATFRIFLTLEDGRVGAPKALTWSRLA